MSVFREFFQWLQMQSVLIRDLRNWFALKHYRSLVGKGRVSLGVRKLIYSALILVLVVSGMLSSAFSRSVSASNVNVLSNGGFEGGFTNQPGCGAVGAGWRCFHNDGAANYSFYDEQWSSVVAEGAHSQLIEINTKGIPAPDHNRYVGLYQTVPVVDWAGYTLSLRGMIRTTYMDGDPWGYRVEVGWTAGQHADWRAVTNWRDVGWDGYYSRTSLGVFSSYSAHLMAEDDFITIYIRFLKKWGVPEEEVNVNFDAITLTGSAVGGMMPPPISAPTAPAAVPGGGAAALCTGPELVLNGNFEGGFVKQPYGLVGAGWWSFTNDGAAGYGFYEEKWPPVVVNGARGQLIEINGKGIAAPENNRYAGISQWIGGLRPGATYELSIRGLLRGAGYDPDPDRFVAQWGWNAGRNNDWSKVANWTSMNLGMIYDRESPGAMGAYTIRFTAPAPEIVLFVRGWKKWGIAEAEMDLNLDAISLKNCGGHHQPHSHPNPPQSCLYVVQPGDTLSVIAQHAGVALHDLATANQIWDYNLIYIGQTLQLPGCVNAPPALPPATLPPPPAATPLPPAMTRKHIVAPGETLSYLCDVYGVDVWTLAAVNGLADPNFIYVGQVLMIP